MAAGTDATDAPALAVEDLTVRVGQATIVDRVSFEASAGDVVAVIGPNGAGKTTLLEAIVGLRPSRGRVRVRGRDLRSFAHRAASFAFAPDDVSLPPEVLVEGLVDHARAHRPRDGATVDALLSDLRLGPLLERSPGALSRGERKRVTLALALASDRAVVVLDEPFGAFDPLQLREVLRVVRTIARAGAAIVVSVHQLHDAERVADRVLLLSEGRRLAFGTIDAIRAQAGSAGSLEDAFVALLSSTGRHRAA